MHFLLEVVANNGDGYLLSSSEFFAEIPLIDLFSNLNTFRYDLKKCEKNSRMKYNNERY